MPEPLPMGNGSGGFLELPGQFNRVENPDIVFYTLEEVAKHNTPADCWTIYKGMIYDVTQYAS